MNGLIYTLLEDFVCTHYGAQQFEHIYELALPKLLTKDPFIGPCTYPEHDFSTLCSTASQHLKIPHSQFVEQYANYVLAVFLDRSPRYLRDIHQFKQLLMAVVEHVNTEGRKLYRDSWKMDLRLVESSSNSMQLAYFSQESLDNYLQVMIKVIAAHCKSNAIKITRSATESEQAQKTISISYAEAL